MSEINENNKSTERIALEYLAKSMQTLLLSKNIGEKRQIRKDIRKRFKMIGVTEHTPPNILMAKIIMGIGIDRCQMLGWKLACESFEEKKNRKMGGIKPYIEGGKWAK